MSFFRDLGYIALSFVLYFLLLDHQTVNANDCFLLLGVSLIYLFIVFLTGKVEESELK